MARARVISFINYKGGVGKSTTTYHMHSLCLRTLSQSVRLEPNSRSRESRTHCRRNGQSQQIRTVGLAFGLSVLLIALAARGVLDPLTGALAQSVAVFAVVANSARILRFAGPVLK